MLQNGRFLRCSVVASFSRGIGLPFACGGEIVLAQTLVDLCDGVPASAVLLYAPLLHEEPDEILLLFADAPEVVEERPAVHIKLVFDVLVECPLPRLRDIVVGSRVALFRVRYADSHLVLLLSVRKSELRLRHECQFDEFRLDASVVQSHRFRAAVSVHEPLTQVAWHFQIDVVFAHNRVRLRVMRKVTHKHLSNNAWRPSFSICYEVGRQGGSPVLYVWYKIWYHNGCQIEKISVTLRQNKSIRL
jgi:hypothetical protein